MNPYRFVVATLIAGLILWGSYRVYRAHSNLVTLNVRNMEVRQVVSKIESQTWERILVNKDVAGKVTLNVHNVPLEEVLNIVALQADARWTALYPIYRTGKAAVAFNKVVRGDQSPDGSGWSNLQKIPAWQKSVVNGFANTLRAENKLVSAQIVNKDLSFVALALSRFSKALVVPEDGANGTINLKLQQTPFKKAVAQVAKQAHRKWDELYALQPLRSAAVARKDIGDATSLDTNQVMVKRVMKEEMTNAPETALEALMVTMTPEQRKETQERIATMEQIRSLPEGERQQRMQEVAAQASQAPKADLEQRLQNRLKNSTPDQRVAHDRAKLARQQGQQK